MKTINFTNYNYDAIKYFITIAKQKSISKAAADLGISQSALSQSMKSLETNLGVTLFNRNTRGIILTPSGLALYKEATLGNEHFENGIIEAIKVQEFGKGKIFKISTTHSLFIKLLAPIMNKIINAYPNIDFDISTEANENNVVELLQNGEIDIAIIKTDEKFITKELELEDICDLEYVFAYNPKYIKINNYKDLKEIPIVLKKRTGKNDSSWLKGTFKRVISCSTDNACMDLITEGIGIGLCPKSFLNENLQEVPLHDNIKIKRTVTSCYIKNNDIAKFITQKIKEQENNKML